MEAVTGVADEPLRLFSLPAQSTAAVISSAPTQSTPPEPAFTSHFLLPTIDIPRLSPGGHVEQTYQHEAVTESRLPKAQRLLTPASLGKRASKQCGCALDCVGQFFTRNLIHDCIASTIDPTRLHTTEFDRRQRIAAILFPMRLGKATPKTGGEHTIEGRRFRLTVPHPEQPRIVCAKAFAIAYGVSLDKLHNIIANLKDNGAFDMDRAFAQCTAAKRQRAVSRARKKEEFLRFMAWAKEEWKAPCLHNVHDPVTYLGGFSSRQQVYDWFINDFQSKLSTEYRVWMSEKAFFKLWDRECPTIQVYKSRERMCSVCVQFEHRLHLERYTREHSDAAQQYEEHRQEVRDEREILRQRYAEAKQDKHNRRWILDMDAIAKVYVPETHPRQPREWGKKRLACNAMGSYFAAAQAHRYHVWPDVLSESVDTIVGSLVRELWYWKGVYKGWPSESIEFVLDSVAHHKSAQFWAALTVLRTVMDRDGLAPTVEITIFYPDPGHHHEGRPIEQAHSVVKRHWDTRSLIGSYEEVCSVISEASSHRAGDFAALFSEWFPDIHHWIGPKSLHKNGWRIRQVRVVGILSDHQIRTKRRFTDEWSDWRTTSQDAAAKIPEPIRTIPTMPVAPLEFHHIRDLTEDERKSFRTSTKPYVAGFCQQALPAWERLIEIGKFNEEPTLPPAFEWLQQLLSQGSPQTPQNLLVNHSQVQQSPLKPRRRKSKRL